MKDGVVQWLLERLTEKTTWLGVAGLVAVAFHISDQALLDAIGNAVGAVAGAILIFGKEKEKPTV